jgi:hypothetical protein
MTSWKTQKKSRRSGALPAFGKIFLRTEQREIGTVWSIDRASFCLDTSNHCNLSPSVSRPKKKAPRGEPVDVADLDTLAERELAPRLLQNILRKCEADHILVAAMNVKNFSMTRFGRLAMQTNMDVVLALGFIALALICVAAEVLYFLPLPI